MIPAFIIDQLKQEQERRDRENEEGRRLPLYPPEYPLQRKKENETQSYRC